MFLSILGQRYALRQAQAAVSHKYYLWTWPPFKIYKYHIPPSPDMLINCWATTILTCLFLDLMCLAERTICHFLDHTITMLE